MLVSLPKFIPLIRLVLCLYELFCRLHALQSEASKFPGTLGSGIDAAGVFGMEQESGQTHIVFPSAINSELEKHPYQWRCVNGGTFQHAMFDYLRVLAS